MDDTIDFSKLIKDIADMSAKFQEFFNDLCEVIREIAEKIGEILRDKLKIQEKPKYKFIKSQFFTVLKSISFRSNFIELRNKKGLWLYSAYF